MGGALGAARRLQELGLDGTARQLSDASLGAFLHSLAGSLRVASAVAFTGSVMAALLLPSRPRAVSEPAVAIAVEPGA